MRRVVVLSLALLLQFELLALNKTEFVQQFEGRYLVVIGEGLPICLKVSNRKVRAVNQQDVCARLQRTSIRQNGEVCIKPDHPGASARCELVNQSISGHWVMGEAKRPIQVYHSKQALLSALKAKGRQGFENPLIAPIKE